jgi:hypothetical protein
MDETTGGREMSDILQDLFGEDKKPKQVRVVTPKPKLVKTPKFGDHWLSVLDSYCKQYQGKKRSKNVGMIIKKCLGDLGLTEQELREEIESWKNPQ